MNKRLKKKKRKKICPYFLVRIQHRGRWKIVKCTVKEYVDMVKKVHPSLDEADTETGFLHPLSLIVTKRLS